MYGCPGLSEWLIYYSNFPALAGWSFGRIVLAVSDWYGIIVGLSGPLIWCIGRNIRVTLVGLLIGVSASILGC